MECYTSDHNAQPAARVEGTLQLPALFQVLGCDTPQFCQIILPACTEQLIAPRTSAHHLQSPSLTPICRASKLPRYTVVILLKSRPAGLPKMAEQQTSVPSVTQELHQEKPNPVDPSRNLGERNVLEPVDNSIDPENEVTGLKLVTIHIAICLCTFLVGLVSAKRQPGSAMPPLANHSGRHRTST